MGQSFVTLQTALCYCDRNYFNKKDNNLTRACRRAKRADARRTLNEESEFETNLRTEQVLEELEGVDIVDNDMLDETKSFQSKGLTKSS